MENTRIPFDLQDFYVAYQSICLAARENRLSGKSDWHGMLALAERFRAVALEGKLFSFNRDDALDMTMHS